MPIELTSDGSFDRTANFLDKLLNNDMFDQLAKYGDMGVDALRSATPKDTGKTAASWDYRIGYEGDSVAIEWFNTNSAAGTSVALLIQYGHGTGTGGYVPGRDYINPAIQPVFDEILNSILEEVLNA